MLIAQNVSCRLCFHFMPHFHFRWTVHSTFFFLYILLLILASVGSDTCEGKAEKREKKLCLPAGISRIKWCFLDSYWRLIIQKTKLSMACWILEILEKLSITECNIVIITIAFEKKGYTTVALEIEIQNPLPLIYDPSYPVVCQTKLYSCTFKC